MSGQGDLQRKADGVTHAGFFGCRDRAVVLDEHADIQPLGTDHCRAARGVASITSGNAKTWPPRRPWVVAELAKPTWHGTCRQKAG